MMPDGGATFASGGTASDSVVGNANEYATATSEAKNLRHRVHDEHEDEDWRDAFQGLDEQVAENRDGRHGLRRGDREQDAEHEADGDQLDQRGLLIFLTEFLQHGEHS